MNTMLAYVLDKEINGEKILKDIQKLVVKFKQQSDSVPILHISIRTISQEDNGLIPKLEYKEIS